MIDKRAGLERVVICLIILGTVKYVQLLLRGPSSPHFQFLVSYDGTRIKQNGTRNNIMAAPKFQSHLGMVDLLPEHTPLWRKIEQTLHDQAALFDFHEIRTPMMEQTELIVRGVGATSDIVSKEIFAFEKGDSHYILRPECTAPVVRAYIEHHLGQRGGAQKLYYIGPMFRAERPQKGRLRQFHQFGVEVLGSAHPIADIETIQLLLAVLEALGLTDWTLKLNSVGDRSSREAYKNVLVEYLTPFASQLSETSQKRLETNPMRILDSKDATDQPIIEDAPSILDSLNDECQAHFAQVRDGLDALGIPYELTPKLVRGMDYYTQTAFEVTSTALGSQDAIAGGGRYDLLVEELGGTPTPAVGFAMGMERLILAMQSINHPWTLEESANTAPHVYLVTLGEQAQTWGLSALQTLRSKGIAATTDMQGRSMKAQMKDANRSGARFTLIVGEQELQQERFVLRNMDESSEETLSFDDVIQRLQAIPASN